MLTMELVSSSKASTTGEGNVEERRQCPTITATIKGPRILDAPGFSPQWGTLSAHSGDCTAERGIADRLKSSVSLSISARHYIFRRMSASGRVFISPNSYTFAGI